MVERDVFVFQFSIDGTETAYHNILSDAGCVFFCLTIIPAGSNHRFTERVGLRITNDDDREHVYFFRIECGKSRYVYFLFISACLADISHRSLRRAPFLQKQFPEAV